MNAVTVLLWGSLAAGIVPMTWFLARFRPSWPIKSPAYLISGLVLAILIAYLRVGVVIAIRGWVPRMYGFWDAFFSITPLLIVDVMVIALLINFRRFRAAWLSEMDRRSK